MGYISWEAEVEASLSQDRPISAPNSCSIAYKLHSRAAHSNWTLFLYCARLTTTTTQSERDHSSNGVAVVIAAD